MAQLKYVKGDATNPQAEKFVLIHVANNANGFGSGFAKAVANKWPEVKKVYHSLFDEEEDWFNLLGQNQC